MSALYKENEENFNVLSHFLGFFLAILATLYLIFLKANSLNEILSYLVYGFSGILLYLMSTLYHASKRPRARRLLKICDHAAIYIFIAGCYTPFIVLHLKTENSLKLLSCIWALALIGSFLKLFLTGRFRILSTFIYLGMGWLVVTLGEEISYLLSMETILWLVAGGLSYSFGTFFYLYKGVPFHHGIWHLFVLLGSFLHFMALLSA